MTFALVVNNLNKTYANGLIALNGISFEVEAGDFFALLGKNGAGKSTTIGILCSLIKKTAGKVFIFGHDIEVDLNKAKACLGIVPQEINFNLFETVSQVLINQAGYYGVPRNIAKHRAALYLKKMELWDKRHYAVRQLSGGFKRRLMIARALMNEPKLLILDEPTAGVDIELRHLLWDFLKELNQKGTTVILTTHYLEEAEDLCKKIAIIDHGEIIVKSDMKSFINRLVMQALILDLNEPIAFLPQLPNYPYRLIDSTTLEVEIHQGNDINGLFIMLSNQGIQVRQLRNKTNRLEDMFIRLTKNGEKGLYPHLSL
jgi:ABC-2 type transport system ATP-binding protein